MAKYTVSVAISVCRCVLLCRVILCCFKVILRYSPCFCTSSFVNSCIASCIVGIHFPFKEAAGRSCKLLHRVKHRTLVSQTKLNQTSPTANTDPAGNCNYLVLVERESNVHVILLWHKTICCQIMKFLEV